MSVWWCKGLRLHPLSQLTHSGHACRTSISYKSRSRPCSYVFTFTLMLLDWLTTFPAHPRGWLHCVFCVVCSALCVLLVLSWTRDGSDIKLPELSSRQELICLFFSKGCRQVWNKWPNIRSCHFSYQLHRPEWAGWCHFAMAACVSIHPEQRRPRWIRRLEV